MGFILLKVAVSNNLLTKLSKDLLYTGQDSAAESRDCCLSRSEQYRCLHQLGLLK